ncbi:hypothetical protein KTH73_04095 [Acinetobacter courvalinii]|uniref:hypothetical protein n=1 Tax=Acinetobacter courvalinii TaxID=280147 RepID=UPI0021CD32A0|nr:hypothetical protein [Acinetobacter courvalinii]MCU4389908.1 hypothetical protein [Acinetobacter courvalinii]
MSGSKKWETKEVIYIFVISILLQFIGYYFAFIYGGSVKALGYISFAGTLVSILLAVIAIGYTYGESIRQKGSQDELINQIRDLTEIKDNLGSQVNVLENIANLKKSVDEKIDESINFIRDNLDKYKDPQNNPKDDQVSEKNAYDFLKNTNQPFDMYVLVLNKVFNENDIISFNQFVNLLFKFFKSEDVESENVKAYVKFEAAIAIYSALESLDLIGNFKLDEQVIQTLKSKYSDKSVQTKDLNALLKDI